MTDLPPADALLDELRESDRALRLVNEERTAFATFDPEAGEGDREEFYWYEFEWADRGPAAEDDALSAGDLAFRIGAWTVLGVVPAERMAEAIVETGPTTVWFWADSLDALEDQLHAHYHSGLYVAEKDALVSPEAESFTVEDSLSLGNLWPETRERDGDDWNPADHNEATATDEKPVMNSVEFFETTVYAGGGRYVVELPRRDRLREEFATTRPFPKETTTACSKCRRWRPVSARFCDWCGDTLGELPDPPRRERVASAVASPVGHARERLSGLRARVGERLRPRVLARRGR